MKHIRIALLVLALLLLASTTVSADSGYTVALSQFHGTGETHLSSASFGLQGTVTWTGMGRMNSSSYVLSSGFYPAAALKSVRKVFVPLVMKNNS